MDLFGDLVLMPCYEWNRAVVVPKGHPLIDVKPLTLEAVAAEPIVTYVFGFTGRSKLDDAFVERGLSPHVVFTATDTDVIKTYVRLGLGIGIVAAMSYDPDSGRRPRGVGCKSSVPSECDVHRMSERARSCADSCSISSSCSRRT